MTAQTEMDNSDIEVAMAIDALDANATGATIARVMDRLNGTRDTNIYRMLRKLEARGLVSSSQRRNPLGGHPNRIYHLSPRGRELLAHGRPVSMSSRNRVAKEK